MRSGAVAVALALGVGGLACAGGAGPAPRAEVTRVFSEGNDHYASGRFEEAARDYEQLLSQGIVSEAIHYNLANALFKMNQLGPAILHLEKAALLNPGDPDVRENLEFLRSLTADRTTVAAGQTTTFFLERLLGLTTVDQDAAVFTGLFVLLGILAGWRIVATSWRARRVAVWCLAVVCLPLSLAGAGLGVKLYRAGTQTRAIVLQERVDVLSGPGEDHTTLFTVHEGLKVRIEAEQGSWSEVSLDNGLTGWIPASVLGVI